MSRIPITHLQCMQGIRNSSFTDFNFLTEATKITNLKYLSISNEYCKIDLVLKMLVVLNDFFMFSFQDNSYKIESSILRHFNEDQVSKFKIQNL